MQTDFDIFIPSYHRPDNCKTANYFVKYVGWEPSKITIIIDSEADDRAEYEALAHRLGCKLHVFDMDEARARYDYVHRASVSRRSAGQARNMMQEYAIANGIGFYMVQDDDTQCYTTRWGNMVAKKANPECVRQSFYLIREFMERQRIGLFGISQSGDLIGGCTSNAIYRKKVMNTTFYLMPYIVRGERGVQDDDTSLFTGVMNAGLFTGSVRYGLILHQMRSAKQAGGADGSLQRVQTAQQIARVPDSVPVCHLC